MTLPAKITPVLEEFEAQRKKSLKNWHVSLGIIVPIVIAAMVGIAALSPDETGAYFIPVGLGLFGGAISLHYCTASYKSRFKECIVRPIIESYLPGMRYEPTRAIDRSQYDESRLFLKGVDRYKGEDYVCGQKEQTPFEFSELHTEYKTTTHNSKGGTRTTWHTIFKGIFFIADFNKDFNGRTFVLPDTMESMLGKFGQKLQSMNFSRPELIKLEDPEFEKTFCVYGEDQIESRYILSPSLMRRILDYKNKFGNQIFLSFYRSKVAIALSSGKNRFEPRIFSPVTDPSLVAEYLADLNLLVGIIDDLNLNLRIWSKE